MAKDQRMPAAEPLLRPRKMRDTANLPLRQIEMSTLPQPSSRRGRIALGLTVTILTILAFFLVGQASLPAEDGAKPTQRLEIQPGDHICIIGNTLADRMQHDGWLETLLHSRFPQHELVFRNLGFSGDEVAGFTDQPNPNFRMRSQAFGTADQWLAGSAPVPEPNRLTTRNGVRDNRFETTNTKADVIFAFLGYNESFAGPNGLSKFEKDLHDFIKHARAQKYNGKSAPRLVLFSPIAHEDQSNIPNWPAGPENNERLARYTIAIAEVAQANDVPFVDLFHPMQAAYTVAARPLTINGIHLTSEGNKVLGQIIDRSLFGPPDSKRDPKELEKLRQAILDKNFYWFNRYRVMAGYNVYGGRAFERYADKQSNYEDQQRELEILDVKAANRDKRIWAIARGEPGASATGAIDDSNCPPLIPVKSNKPGNGPNGEHILLDGEAAIQKMTVAKNMKVTLFASEKEFPELAKPVQMQFDAQGRLWVAVWPSYPHWKPTEEMNDTILIFEDTKGTGKADKVTVFADHLNCPTGFEVFNGV